MLDPSKFTTKNYTHDVRIIRKLLPTFSCHDEAADTVQWQSIKCLHVVCGFKAPTSVVVEDDSALPGSSIATFRKVLSIIVSVCINVTAFEKFG